MSPRLEKLLHFNLHFWVQDLIQFRSFADLPGLQSRLSHCQNRDKAYHNHFPADLLPFHLLHPDTQQRSSFKKHDQAEKTGFGESVVDEAVCPGH